MSEMLSPWVFTYLNPESRIETRGPRNLIPRLRRSKQFVLNYEPFASTKCADEIAFTSTKFSEFESNVRKSRKKVVAQRGPRRAKIDYETARSEETRRNFRIDGTLLRIIIGLSARVAPEPVK